MNQQSLTKSAAEQLPAHLQNERHPEDDPFDDRHILQPPRLKFVQPGSLEVAERKAQPGDLYSLARQMVLPQPVTFIPICRGNEWIKFKDQKDGPGGLDWRTTDPKDPRATYEHYQFNVLALVEGELEVIGFRSSHLPIAKIWQNEAKRLNAPQHAQVWELKTVPKVEGKKHWYLPVLTFKGFCSAEQYQQTKRLYEAFRESFNRIETQEMDNEKGGGQAPEGDVPF